MSRDLLTQAIDEVTQASDAAAKSVVSDRLDDLAERLRHQAGEKQSTLALDALDRIRYGLGEVAEQSSNEAVSEPLARAQEHIMSFLGTLEDRGMTQYGWTPENETVDENP